MENSSALAVKKVESAFLVAFGLDPERKLSELEYNTSPEWDSVAHMVLVTALEEEFDCMLEMDDILDMSSYAKAVEIMGKYA